MIPTEVMNELLNAGIEYIGYASAHREDKTLVLKLANKVTIPFQIRLRTYLSLDNQIEYASFDTFYYNPEMNRIEFRDYPYECKDCEANGTLSTVLSTLHGALLAAHNESSYPYSTYTWTSKAVEELTFGNISEINHFNSSLEWIYLSLRNVRFTGSVGYPAASEGAGFEAKLMVDSDITIWLDEMLSNTDVAGSIFNGEEIINLRWMDPEHEMAVFKTY